MNNDNNSVKPCSNCGRNLRSDATFCYICGYNFVTKKGGNTIPPKVETNEDLIKDNHEFVQGTSEVVGKTLSSGIKSIILDGIIYKVMGFIILLIVLSLVFGGLASDGTSFWIYIIGIIVVLIIVIIILTKYEHKHDLILKSNLNQLKQRNKGLYLFVIVILLIILFIVIQ